MICQMLSTIWSYPLTMSICTFYCLGLQHSSFTDFLTFAGSLYYSALTGAFFGLTVGTITDDMQLAILIGNLNVTVFQFGGGCFANTGEGMNPVIQFLVWISPMHYSNELIFKEVT